MSKVEQSKGERTKERVIEQAAQLFNQQGYFSAPLSAIMAATGLQKGGIYNHFSSKEELALQAADYAYDLIGQRFVAALKAHRHSQARLLALMDVYRQMVEEPPLPGGCPLLNTAIESDDAHPSLRAHAQVALSSWRSIIRRTVEWGIRRGEIRPEVEADTVATIAIAIMEGAIMMSKLTGDNLHLHRAIDHLTAYLTGLQVGSEKIEVRSKK